MGAFLVYIIKSSLCLAMFYLFYRLLLSRETFHRFNRIALICILILSVLIPFLQVSIAAPVDMNQNLLSLEDLLLLYSSPHADVALAPETGGFHTAILVSMAVYLLGIGFFVVRNLWSISRMLLLMRHSSVNRQEDGYILFTHNKEIAPFSWMKYIFISEKDFSESANEIMAHEISHIRNRHSLDLILADVCIFMQWFNPAAWLLKTELQNIHEYEADESVLNTGIDAKKYQLLLIKKAVGTRHYSMANSFNHSSLKKRITMMLKEKSNKWACAKYLCVLPLAAIAIVAFARPEVSNELKEISNVKINDLTTSFTPSEVKSIEKPVVQDPQKTEDPVFTVVETMPSYPGGTAPMLDFISKSIKYPAKAKQEGIQGRVMCGFVVEKNGSLSDVKVLRGIDPELDAEAVRVIESMPRWTPGKQRGQDVRVKYALPITFRLQENNSEAKNLLEESKIKITNPRERTVDAVASTNNLLYILDGQKITAAEMKKVSPDDIAQITVLKDEKATAIYGEEGENGVILITSKK